MWHPLGLKISGGIQILSNQYDSFIYFLKYMIHIFLSIYFVFGCNESSLLCKGFL